MKTPVAMFADAFAQEPRTVELSAILAKIQSGGWRGQVEALRTLLAKDEEVYQVEKRKLPAFCVSGTAEDRTTPLVHSNLLQVDLDHLNGTIEAVRQKVKADPHVAFGFVSPSGDGLKLGVVIDGTDHQRSFEAVREYFQTNYAITIDKKVKDRLRLCFVSSDPDTWTNEAAVPLPLPEMETPGESQTSAELSVIILPSGAVSISESARAIFTRIAPSHTLFFRGGALVELVKNEGVSGLDVCKPDGFRSRVERFCRLMAWRRGKKDQSVLSPAKMSKDDAGALIAAQEARELLPPVASVLRCPALIEATEGQVMVIGQGYHAEAGGLLIVAGKAPPQVPTGEAVASLSWLLEEFDFQTPGDRSRAIAAFVTPALRIGGYLHGSVPVDVAEADQSQSGKGYRHHLVCALYNEAGYFVTARQGGVGSVDESFASALIAGRPFICLDNFRGRLDSQHLEAFLTCPGLFPARIPHRGEVMIDPRRFLLQMSSNGLEATRDLVNRASICRIKKRPGFQYRDTLAELQRRQPYFLGCVFGVVTEWIAHGKPRTNDTRHDFREWCQVLDWIVQNIFRAAPLMDGHESAQERVSNPALSWLRAVALAVEREDRLGDTLIASELAELCTLRDIDIPGVKEATDEDKARKQVGVLMRRCFGQLNVLDIDGFRITRSIQYQLRNDGGGPMESKTYVFTKA